MKLYLLILFLLLAQPSFSQNAWQHVYSQAQDSYQQGNLRESYRLGQQALIQAKMEFGVNSEYYAGNLHLLTLIAYSSSRFQDGIGYAAQEVSSRQQLGQSGTPIFGQALYNLGLLYLASGQYSEAVSYLKTALAVFKASPSEKLDMAQTQYQLGRAYQGQNESSAADSLFSVVIQMSAYDSLLQDLLVQSRYQQALLRLNQQGDLASLYELKEQFEQQKDTTHLLYLHTLGWLASAEEENGNWQQASNLYEHAKTLLESSGNTMDSLQYAHVIDKLGLLAMMQGNIQLADSCIRKAYQIRHQRLNPRQGAYWISVDHMAQVYQEKEHTEQAARFYEENIRKVSDQEAETPYQYAVVLNNLALLYWEEEQYIKANHYYKQAVQKIDREDTSSVRAQRHKASIYYNVARNYQSQNYFDTAIYYYKRSIDLSKQYAGDKSAEYMAALSGIASLYQDIGYFTEAEIFYREALQIQEVVTGKESNEYANLLNNFALLVQAKGDYRQAEALLKEVLGLKKKLLGENAIQTIAVLSNLGLFYLDIAAYKEARPLLEKALTSNQQQLSSTHPALISNLVNLARLEMAEANYSKAEPLLKRAVRIAEMNYGANHPELAKIRLEMANFYLTLANYPAAASLLQESRRVLRAQLGPLHPDYATATQDMAILYEATGEYAEAEQLFEETLQIDRQTLGKQHPDYAISLNNLASFYQNVGRSKEAQPLLEEALSITQSVFGKNHPAYMATLLNLGLLYQELEQYDKAEPILNEVVELRKRVLGEKHPDYAYALYSKAVLYHRLGRYQEAAPIFREVVNNYSRQIKSYFPALSEKEKSAFYKRIEPVLNAYRDFVVDLLINKAYKINTVSQDEMLETLYNVQLITKAMLLDASSKIRKNILNGGSPQLKQTYHTWIGVKEKLAQAYTLSRQALQEKGINIRNLERKANELEKELSSGSTLFAQDIEKKNLTWQDVRHSLGNEEAAMEIIRGHKEKENIVFYIALLVAPSISVPKLVVLPDGKEMENKNYFYYKNAIEFRVKDDLSYDLYWLPLREALPANVRTVYIAPDGIYNKISLNSLYNAHQQRFVLDEVNIRMLSSTRELLEEMVSTGAVRNQQAYLFGYPNYRYEIGNQHASDTLKGLDKPLHLLANAESEMYPFRYGISLLPGTQREINYVDDLLHHFQWNTFKFMENVAMEENVKQVKNPRLLHIATHGYFMSDLPVEDNKKAFGVHLGSMAANPLLRSGLLLAGSENTIMASEADENIVHDREAEDGILTAYEAMNLDLNGTDLVVLSACETGLGEVKNGEGVYGLQRAFLVAGAHSVMMSLWKVSDLSTTELIKTFYTNWLSGQDKFSALRNAQLTVKEEYGDPYYWGAFVLMGR